MAFACRVTDVSYSGFSSSPNEKFVLRLYSIIHYWFPEFELKKASRFSLIKSARSSNAGNSLEATVGVIEPKWGRYWHRFLKIKVIACKYTLQTKFESVHLLWQERSVDIVTSLRVG